MAQKLIRDIPEGVMSAIEAKASANGKNAEAWIRDLLAHAVSGPIVHERYGYRFYGPDGAHGTVKRLSNHVNGITGNSNNLSTDQMNVVTLAKDLMRRNDPGDQLKAYDLLKANFEEVFEVPV